MGVSEGVMDCDTEMEGEEEGERVPSALRECEGDAVLVLVICAEPVTESEAVAVAEMVTVGEVVLVGATGVRVASVVTVMVGLSLGGTDAVPECVTEPVTEGEGDSEGLTEEEADAEGLAVGVSEPDTVAEEQLVGEGVVAAESE